MLTFLAVQAFIFLSWLLWVERGAISARPAPGGRAVLLVSAALFAFGQIVLTSTILGSVGLLEPRRLLALNVGIAVVMTASVLFRTGPLEPAPAAGKFTLKGLPCFQVVLNVALTLLLLLVIVLTVAQAAAFGPYTTDGLWYHLPMVLFMRQQHSFAAVGLPLIDSYPHNAELWQHWIYSFFDNDTWLDLHQLPFLFLMVLSVYCIARRLGISRGTSYAAALLTAFTPVVLAQVGTELVDVVVAALLAASVAMLLECTEDESPLTWTMSFGAGIGLLAGTKFTGIAYAGILFTAWAGTSVARRRSHFILHAAAVLIPALTCGAYVYTVNCLRYGNPLYPYHVVLPFFDLAGPYEFSAMWEEKSAAGASYLSRLIHSWLAVGQAGYGWHSGGLGLTWLLLLATVPVALWRAVRAKNRAFLALAALFAVLFAVTPLNYSSRFVVFIVSFGAVSWALLQAGDPKSWPAVIAQSLALLCAVFVVMQRIWLLQFEAGERGSTPDSVCARSGFPKSFIPSYRWVSENLGPRATVVAFLDGEWEVSLYCLWNPAKTSRLVLAGPAEEIFSGDVLFIPRSSRANRYSGLEKKEFADESVTIAVNQPVPASRPAPPAAAR